MSGQTSPALAKADRADMSRTPGPRLPNPPMLPDSSAGELPGDRTSFPRPGETVIR